MNIEDTLVENPFTEDDQLLKLIGDGKIGTMLKAAGRENLSPKVQVALLEKSSGTTTIFDRLCNNSSFCIGAMEESIKSGRHLHEFSRWRGLPAELQVLIVSKADTFSIRQNIAKREDIYEEAAHRLLKDPSVGVKSSLAGNRMTPPNVLHMLATRESSDSVLNELSSNPACREETVRLIWEKGSRIASVRNRLARRPDPGLDEAVWELLLKSKDKQTYLELSKNHHCPMRVLDIISNECIDRLAGGGYDYSAQASLMNITENHNVGAGTLWGISRCNDHKDIRAYVAKSANATRALLDRLSRDKYSEVRMAVAGNLNTDEKTLRFIAEDRSENRAAIISMATNPFISSQFATFLWKKWGCIEVLSNGATNGITLSQAMALPDPEKNTETILAILSHPNLHSDHYDIFNLIKVWQDKYGNYRVKDRIKGVDERARQAA
jgi:hypothetical protein